MTAWSASVRSGNWRPYLPRKRWWLAALSGETPSTGTPAAWKAVRLSLNWQASLVHTVSSSPLTVDHLAARRPAGLPAIAPAVAAGRRDDPQPADPLSLLTERRWFGVRVPGGALQSRRSGPADRWPHALRHGDT